MEESNNLHRKQDTKNSRNHDLSNKEKDQQDNNVARLGDDKINITTEDSEEDDEDSSGAGVGDDEINIDTANADKEDENNSNNTNTDVDIIRDAVLNDNTSSDENSQTRMEHMILQDEQFYHFSNSNAEINHTTPCIITTAQIAKKKKRS